ncbi:hypothetical protein ACH5RR_001361 [Cinchona calisaya]|uniref:FAF domain-containing protein n=1 Tax=Cinchona calisaya TaxID=153742 RepID=A0ABD3B3R0_9GENT
MMTESVHSFLGFPTTKNNGTVDLDCLFHHQTTTPAAGGGLGVVNLSDNRQKPADVLEFSDVKSPLVSPPFSTSTSSAKRDPGGIGFIDDVGGSVDGLMSCTESLGFESSDERRIDDDIEELCCRKESFVGLKWKREHVKKEVKEFPPPLSSLNQNGKPTFFLRPVRKDGKLELKEVKIGRPEILRVFREDGRLRLHLIRNEDEDEDVEEEFEGEEEEEEEVVDEETTGKVSDDGQEMVEGKIEDEEVEEKVLEERVDEGWQIPVTPAGAGEGFRRCHEQVSEYQNRHQHGHHHHHDLHVWRQHCVTIR